MGYVVTTIPYIALKVEHGPINMHSNVVRQTWMSSSKKYFQKMFKVGGGLRP